MAADAGIFQQYMQPVRSVADYRGDMDREEQNALQLAAGRMQAQQAQRAMADDDAYRAAAQETGGDQNALVKALMGRGLVKQAQAVQTGMLETEAKRGTIAKDKTATDAAKYDLEQKKRAAAATGLANLKSPQEAVADLQAKIQAGEVTPEQGDALLKTIPQDPVEFTKWQLGTLRSLLTPQQQIEMTTAKPTEVNDGQTKFFRDMNPNSPTYGKVVDGSKVQLQASPEAVMTDARTRSEGAANRGVTLRGQNLTNERAREANAQKTSAGGANLSPTAQKELFEADDAVQNGIGAIGSLKKALELNNKAYSGVGASTRATIRSNLPGQSEEADATIAMENIIMDQALTSMKSIFGGNPTEGERAILLDLQASASKTPAQRKSILERAMASAEKRVDFNRNKAESLRSGAYMRPSGAPNTGGAIGSFDAPKATKSGATVGNW